MHRQELRAQVNPAGSLQQNRSRGCGQEPRSPGGVVLSPTLYLVRVCEPVERLSIKYTQTPPPHSPLRHSADWRGSVQCRDSGAGGVSPVRVNW
eukprot:scaffold39762_cov59-Phaeocystis_antarctica.AAC.2